MQPITAVLPVEIRVRKLYGRFLSAWAIDLMSLRRQGLATPSARDAEDLLMCPNAVNARQPQWYGGQASQVLTWRPATNTVRAAA